MVKKNLAIIYIGKNSKSKIGNQLKVTLNGIFTDFLT